MRLVLISSRYFPESSPGAKRATDLVTALRSAGHRVTVLTQLPPPPEGGDPGHEAPSGKGPVIEEESDGQVIWRFPPKRIPKSNLLRRLLEEARFARRVSRPRTGLDEIDGVVTSTPYVFNLLAAKSYRVPMWLDVRDLTWEYVRDLGSSSLAKKAGAATLRRVALRTLRRAHGVSTTTDGQRAYLVRRGVPEERVHVLPNGVPGRVIDELARLRAGARREEGAPVKVVYAGLLGFPQGLGFAVDTVADRMGDGVELHLYGDGVDRTALVESTRRRGPGRVCIHDPVPYEDYLRVIAGADILLVSLRQEVRTAVPSKVLEYMAAGRPVLYIGEGDGAEVVKQAGAGVVVPHGDRQLLEERLRELARDPKLREELGESGRAWVTRSRVREEINSSWVRRIEEAFEGAARPRRKSTPGHSSEGGRRGGGMRAVLIRSASLAARGAEACGLLRLLERSADGRSDRLRVLAYHRIVEREAIPDACPGLVSATPQELARQMECLARSYRPVSIAEVLEAKREGRPLPPRAVLVTFDDAYSDFAEEAWPVLKRHGVPAVLFVPTGFPDRPDRAFWWDRLWSAIGSSGVARSTTPFGPIALATYAERLRAFKWLRSRIKDSPHEEALESVDRICRELGEGPGLPPVLGWDALRSLLKEGVALGAHTRSHPMLDRISPALARDEVGGSLEDLERETGVVLPVLAYPSGRYDEETVRAVAGTGVELAFTTGSGVHDFRRGDPLRIERIHVGLRTPRPLLRSQLLGVRRPRWI